MRFVGIRVDAACVTHLAIRTIRRVFLDILQQSLADNGIVRVPSVSTHLQETARRRDSALMVWM